MTKYIESIKRRIIEEIAATDDRELLETTLSRLSAAKVEQTLLEKATTTVRSGITLDQLAIEQDYTPFDMNEWETMSGDLGIEESLEELLAQLD